MKRGGIRLQRTKVRQEEFDTFFTKREKDPDDVIGRKKRRGSQLHSGRKGERGRGGELQ